MKSPAPIRGTFNLAPNVKRTLSVGLWIHQSPHGILALLIHRRGHVPRLLFVANRKESTRCYDDCLEKKKRRLKTS